MKDSNRKELLLLFDGNALVHRAFHALPALTVSKTGEMVNAVYGFANTLIKVLGEFRPTYWAVAFDRPTPTFRHEMFKEYKAQRPATPDELKSQIERVHQLVEAFHIPTFEIDGFEADDILGTLSKQASDCGVETIIVTGDNDMLQLVSPAVKALSPRRTFSDTILYDEEEVKQKYGIKPGQIADFKALVGDSSDNIPGVPGIGEKTAAKLIQQFGSLEEIYIHIEDITPGKLQETLRQHKTPALQSKELATIVTIVPVDLNLEACKVSAYDRNEVIKLFQELEFLNLVLRLPQEITGVETEELHPKLPLAWRETSTMSNIEVPSECVYKIISTESGMAELINQLETAKDFSISLEVEGKEDMTAELIGIAISSTQGKAFYIPVGHRGLNQAEQIPLTQVVAQLKPVLENVSIDKIAHNGKRAMTVLANYGIDLRNLKFDTMIAAYLVGEKNLSLKALAFNRLGVEISLPGESTGTGKKQIAIATLETKQIADDACAIADIMWNLRDSLKDELQRQCLWELYSEVEMPLVPILATMERNGVVLDTGLLRRMSHELGQEILRLEAEIHNSVGHKFNINSHQQLGKVLFEELNLPQSRKTKSGYSTEASTLEAMKSIHPIIELVLEYRQLSKLKSTYVDALPAIINHKTGKVHTNFNQTGTTTGRLSSSEPNLQNLPIRREVGNKIRQAIIAPSGSLLLSADYSQIDLRALAHLSQDPNLIASFTSDEDIHTMTACNIFNVPMDEVSIEMRRNAKTVNFGVIYGMSNYGLEQATNLSREEAAQFIALYFEKYPRVKEYIEATKEQARKLGYVQTVMGRRRLILEINSPNRQVREAAERMAINAPVQGTSADIIKVAMINLYREMEKRNMKSKMLLQIHDELLFQVPEEEVEEMKSLVTELMSEAVKLSVPLKVDIKLGKNWGEMA